MDIYQPQENSDKVEAESAVDMVNSQDSAIASALHELGYKFGTSVQILGVTRGGPADGALEDLHRRTELIAELVEGRGDGGALGVDHVHGGLGLDPVGVLLGLVDVALAVDGLLGVRQANIASARYTRSSGPVGTTVSSRSAPLSR